MSKPPHDIHMHDSSEDFHQCWATAGNHILHQVEHGQLNIFRTTLTPPIREHHVFRLGNKLFTVFIEDVDNRLNTPSSLDGVMHGSIEMNAIPCLMRMQRDSAGKWQVVDHRWGLTNPETGEEIFPPDLVTEEKIEMSEWELKDLAIQTVTNKLKEQGCQIASHCSDPGVDPSIWFADEKEVWSYAIVRAVRYPTMEASIPHNLPAMVEHCKQESENGYFYSISVANNQDAFAPDEIPPMPLWRGDGYLLRASEPIHVKDLLQKH